MTQTVIQIKTELEKANAIRIYLSGKDTDFERELTEYVDALYKKYVPAQVREFIEKADALESDGDNRLQSRRVTRRKPVNGEPDSGEPCDASES